LEYKSNKYSLKIEISPY